MACVEVDAASPTKSFDDIDLLASEKTCLVAGPSASPAAASAREASVPWTRRSRRMISGAALVLGCAVLLFLRKVLTPCQVGSSVSADGSFVSLVESYPQDLLNLIETPEDHDALDQWLSAANAAGDAVRHEPMDKELFSQTHEAIAKAMTSKDPEEAKRVVQKAMRHSVARMHEQRRTLQTSISAARPNLRPRQQKKKEAEPNATVHHAQPLGEQISDAQCAFNILSATNAVAMLAANINDVVKTCDSVEFMDIVNAEDTDTHANVCSVNVAAVAANLASLMTTLALAADECATSAIPNVDALCSGSITGLLTATAAIGGSATLIASSCDADGWYSKVPEGVTPANVGSNARQRQREEEAAKEAANQQAAEARRLGEGEAPPRQLLFGGGKGAVATHCATEILSFLWSISDLAFALNSATNPNLGSMPVVGHSCPPRNLLGGTKFKGPLYRIQEGFCTMDVAAVLVAILSMIALAQLMAVECTDELNLGAICGSGIDGVFTGAAGIAQTGAGVWLACDVAQTPLLHKLLEIAHAIDVHSGNKVSEMFNSIGNIGPSGLGSLRRLNEDRVAELKQQFKRPEDVWLSMGFDLNDPNAAFRKVRRVLPDEDILGLREEEQRKHEVAGGLFGASPTCS